MDGEFTYWRFIEEYHPRFSSDDRVLMADIIFRYLDGDEIHEDDIDWVEGIGTRCDLLQELVKLETSLFAEALASFYGKELCGVE